MCDNRWVVERIVEDERGIVKEGGAMGHPEFF
jgi:hypothetical protein